MSLVRELVERKRNVVTEARWLEDASRCMIDVIHLKNAFSMFYPALSRAPRQMSAMAQYVSKL